MRIYVVVEADNGTIKKHLVSADSQSKAIAAVTTPRFTAKVAEQQELVELVKAGVEVIEA